MENKINILYVDDEELNLQLFATVFKKKFNVITAESGFEGLEKLEENKDICIVISDMKMPEMNGVEFINNAKKKFDNLVYFILTGFEITEEITDALNEKLINKYFKKPFNSKEIENTINEVLC
ncbi:MAG: response regulator [Bacteroidetes bacterium]|nr:MAG: response regulator [Bacteroidota bacterium]